MNNDARLVYEKKTLQEAMPSGISSREELVNLFAQIIHESDNSSAMEEDLNYSAKRLTQPWPKRYVGGNHDPDEKALNIAKNPERIADNMYSNRIGNGDSSSGDDYRYQGRGYIQLTGHSNYEVTTKELQIDLINKPGLAATSEVAVKITILY